VTSKSGTLLRALHVEPRRGRPRDVLDRRGADRRHGERRDPVLVLARDAQRRSAGRENRHVRGERQEPADVLRRVEHLLEVVEDQERDLAERRHDGLCRVAARGLLRPDGASDRREDE